MYRGSTEIFEINLLRTCVDIESRISQTYAAYAPLFSFAGRLRCWLPNA